MLEVIYLKNFQKHRRKEIILQPGVNVLVGPSDVGKSSVLRALRWLCTNRPRGKGFIRLGATSAVVDLTLDGGRVISRRIGKTGNKYLLDGEEFVSFNAGIPEAISNLLNVGELTFQSQHAPMFLLSLPAGEVARELNAVINLAQIDSVLATLAKGVRDARSQVEFTQTRLVQARERRDALAWVTEAEGKVKRAERLEADLATSRSKRLTLASRVKDGRGYAQDYQNATQLILDAAKAISLGDALVELKSKRTRLQNLLTRGKELNNSILNTPSPEVMQGLDRMARGLEITRTRKDRLTRLVQELREAREEVCRLQEIATSAEKELQNLSQDRCPLCGGKVLSLSS